MALVIAMGPKKKGPKMKKEDVLLDDEMDSMDGFEDEDEYDDLEDEEDEMGLDMDEEEDGLFDGMEEDDSDLEMLVEDVISAFESKDTKQLMMALKDFVKSVIGKE